MIKKFFIFLISAVAVYAGECYSILTQTGIFTPVYPYNFTNSLHYKKNKCGILSETIVWDNNLSYVGCYKSFKDANYTLHHIKFNFRDPEIIKHKVTLKDKYVIFPNSPNVKVPDINKILKKYKPEKILSIFPKKFYGSGIAFENLEKLVFLPTVNSYYFYKYYKEHAFSTKVMILYNGVYSLEYLYKKIDNPAVIQKTAKNTYIIKVPVYVSPTASLVFNNKTVLLEAKPKPVFINYNGKLYAKNSKFLTWNLYTHRYDKREHVPKDELLLIGIQTPRPYILGLTGSKTYFVNNFFKGLGYHSASATFGISIFHFPKSSIYDRYNLFTYLSKAELPVGIYVGNTMTDNMMGFYCSEARNSVLIGNLMYDNVIYDIDPHDYSRHLIIARNITARAKHAHGIVTSRQVDYSIIAQNISLNNHSAGIMLDRLSDNNLIYDNLSVLNGYMGISIQESDNNLIYKNKLIGNKIDGIIIRNSLRTGVKDNLVEDNAKNGVEVFTKNIDGLIYRNFARDPYHKATSAVIENNKITNNLLNNITVKNNAAVYLKKNILKNKYASNYGGDLNIFIKKINSTHGTFKLYGIGRPFRRISSDLIKINPSVLNRAVNILIGSSCSNDYISGILAKIYIDKLKNRKLAEKEYLRGISLLDENDMFSYGFFMLSYAKTEKEYVNALSYLAQSVIFGDNRGRIDLSQAVYVIPVNKEDVNKAFLEAVKRLKNYKVTDLNSSALCKITERKKAKIESALKLFEYKFKHSGAKDYYAYCKRSERHFTMFTKTAVHNIYKIFYSSNAPKRAYYKKLLKDNEIIKNTEACKLVSIRLKRISSSLEQYYNKNRKRIIRLISPYIDRYLKLVNEYRLQKVSKQKIYKLMENK